MPSPDELADMLIRTPELRNSPTLAAAAYQAPTETLATGQTLAAVANEKATDQAVTEVAQHHGGKGILGHALGFLGDVTSPLLKPVGTVVGAGLHIAGAPLREVQHQYRYLHDVEARHGPLAAILEGLPMVAGGVLGGALGGPQGAILGAELVGGIADRAENTISHSDSWGRTSNGEAYLDPSGHKVSIGRDLAGILNLKEGSQPFTWVSGASDMISDFALDPLAKVGKLSAEARSAEGASGMLANRFGGLSFSRAEDVDRAVEQYGSVRRAFQDIADKNAGEIVADYPKLAGISGPLHNAKTLEEVTAVFKDQAAAQEVISGILPTKSALRTPLTAVSDKVQDWGGIGQKNVLDSAGNIVTEIDPATGEAVPLKTLGFGARTIKKMTAKLPESWDRELRGFTNKDFALGDDHSVRGVYMSLRMGGMTKRAAEAAATEFSEALPGQQLVIWRQSMLKSLLQAGLPENAPIVSQMKQELVDASGGAFAERTAKFGYDKAGGDLSQLLLPDGSHTSAALTLSQEGRVAFPKYAHIQGEIRDMHAVSRVLGKADEWVYNHYTQSIFKRMVLLSGGFAGRIVAGELIPRGMADGFGNIFNSAIASNLARLDDMAPEEIGHLQKATAWVLRGAKKINPAISDEDVEFFTNHVRSLDGHIVDHQLSPGHDYSGEVMSLKEKNTRNLYKATQEAPTYRRGDWRAFSPGDTDQPLAWHEQLTELGNDPMHRTAAGAYKDALASGMNEADATIEANKAVTQFLNDVQAGDVQEISPKRLQAFVRHTVSGDPNLTPHEDWAKNIVENMKGATHSGETGVAHDLLLENMANGTSTPIADLEGIPEIQRPKLIKGQELLPQYGKSNMLETVADVGFRRALNPIINKLSREPLYALETQKQYKILEPLLEAGMDKGEALTLAQNRATATMTRYVHNIAERTQFSETARNFMPFFFAQQQAWARAGRLLAENPGAFRQYQLATSMIHEVGHVQKDAEGQDHLVYPGSGFLGAAVPSVLAKIGLPMAGSVPVSVGGDVRSLASVFPMSEQEFSFGPVVSLPLNAMRSMFPELTPAVQGILGEQGANADVISQLIMPNATVRRTYEALTKNDSNRSFANAEISIIQSLSFQQEQAMRKWKESGKSEDDPDAPSIVPGAAAGAVKRQEFLDRVRMQTRVLMMTKAAIGAVAPMSPQMNIGELGMTDEMQALIKAKGFSEGTAEFLRLHPDATPYTVYKTTANTNSPLAATSAAGQFIENNRALMGSHPYAAAWFIPQSQGDFDNGVYNEQLAMGLRHRKSPEQVMKDIYVAQGDRQYFDEDKPAYDKAIAAAGGNKLKVQAIKSQWSEYKRQFQKQNPIWAENIQSGDRGIERTQALDQMRDLFDKGLAPPGPQSDGIKSLLQDWDEYNSLRMPGGTTRAEKQRKALGDRWQAYLKKRATDEPNLAPVIRKIFTGLDPEPLDVPTTPTTGSA